jgi:hypothetical protein
MAKSPAWQRSEGKSEVRGKIIMTKPATCDIYAVCKSSIHTSSGTQGTYLLRFAQNVE